MTDTNPSTVDLPKTYDPATAEPLVLSRWQEAKAFAAVPPEDPRTPSFSIVIPPPNVTAALHLGHALNNTLQDVLIRYHRMLGEATLWLPGTDHAGIATQTVVEKRLLSEGIKRLEMGRDAFVAKTQEWKNEYEAIILEQLEQIGASCDWNRTRFTMDDMCATAVRHAFFILFRDGLIYRGKRLVNWDPITQTALADDEVENEEIHSHMWYLKYPLADGSGYVTVATTRPETMLGDTAVAINPHDPRSEKLTGKNIRLPIVDRIIPIVADDYVVMADPKSPDAKARYASGFLKVTPAHDPNDWDIGLRHNLPIVNVMGPDGAISDRHGWNDVSEQARAFVGLSREDARFAIVEWFESKGLLESVREYSHSVGHSYRSHVPIEPWLSDQWYVRVTDDRLRGSALRAQDPEQSPPLPEDIAQQESFPGDGGLRFFPDRYARSYHDWHCSIRDWCISRQLWWGHQIPVWIRLISIDDAPTNLTIADIDQPVALQSKWAAAGAAHVARRTTAEEVEEAVCVPPETTLTKLHRDDASMSEPELIAALEAEGFSRDPDVLDTWFSSALWPLSTMGWPWPNDYPETKGLLEKFSPTSVLSTAREIITLWVSRMVMFNRYFLNHQLPFANVFVHAMVQDGHGQKMSKSLGNGVDPRDIIFSHGADAMRFTLVQMTTDTQDVRMPVDMVCPHTGETFTPNFVTTPSGYTVAAPIQRSPAVDGSEMVSAYGVATGEVAPTEDRPLARNTSSKFDLGRNFSNKLWNATRFALQRLENAPALGEPVDLSSNCFADRWIIARLAGTIDTLDQALANYHFNVVADTLYDFVWHDICDRYLESVKPTIDKTPSQQIVLGAILDATLRLMHPVCPFVTEALWPAVSSTQKGTVTGLNLPPSHLAALSTWPTVNPAVVDLATLKCFDRAQSLIGQIRKLRSDHNVKPKQLVSLHVPTTVRQLIETTDGMVETLAGIGEVNSVDDANRPAAASTLAFEGAEVLVSKLVSSMDLQSERLRLTKLIQDKSKQVDGFENRLANEGYLKNAKPELIAETRELLAAAQADLTAAQAAITSLG